MEHGKVKKLPLPKYKDGGGDLTASQPGGGGRKCLADSEDDLCSISPHQHRYTQLSPRTRPAPLPSPPSTRRCL